MRRGWRVRLRVCGWAKSRRKKKGKKEKEKKLEEDVQEHKSPRKGRNHGGSCATGATPRVHATHVPYHTNNRKRVFLPTPLLT